MWTTQAIFGTAMPAMDWRQLFRGKPPVPPVPAEPYFSTPESTNWFKNALRGARLYLEYGAGGSTYLAARYKRDFVSVESDRRFLRAVRRKIAGDGLLDETHQAFIHADIGRTAKWGQPAVVVPPDRKRRERFARYSDYPPALLARGAVPDLILVDGRFRLACALKAMRALALAPGWTLAFDDYTNHAHYHAMERLCAPAEIIGHMAIFRPTQAMRLDRLDSLIRRHELDAR